MNQRKDNIGVVQVLPHDIDTERAVLATLMRYNEKFAQYSDLLSERLFYFQSEKGIYRCIEGVISEGGITDIKSLCNYGIQHNVVFSESEGLAGDLKADIDKQTFLKIFQLANSVTLEQDIKRLMNLSKRRASWELLQQASNKVLDLTLDLEEEVNGCMSAMSDLQADINDDGVFDFEGALDELKEIVNDNANGRKISLTTGFKLFDEYFLLRPTTLTFIAAFTSVGKTSLATNIAVNVAKAGVPSAFYSMEMGKAELASRTISKEVGVPASILMNKQLTDFQLTNFDNVAGVRKELPIYIDERSTVSFDKTIRSIRTMVKTRKIKLAIIDYLQIYAQTLDNGEQSLGYMARALKNVAKETGIAVLALSQLNRSGDHPTLKMLRGSGQIEESADHVVLIDRPEAYPDNKVTKYEGEFANESTQGTAKLILAKGRGVGTGCALVGFDSRYTQFYELQEYIPDTANKRIEIDVPF